MSNTGFVAGTSRSLGADIAAVEAKARQLLALDGRASGRPPSPRRVFPS